PGERARSGRAGPGREGRRGAGEPGRHPARRAPAQHPGDVGGVPRGVPGRAAAAARRRWTALRRTRHRRPGRGPHLRPRHDAPRGRQLSRPHHAATEAIVSVVVTHRRYVPYSHAHYAGNLVDGAYALGLFGDVATELCIRTDGDEGLFAS